MSLILDALSRAEGEKRSDPAVIDILAPEPALDEPPVRLWPWIVAFAAVLLATVLALLLWYSGSRPDDGPTGTAPGKTVLADTVATSPVAAAPADTQTQTQQTEIRVHSPAPKQTPAEADEIAALYAQPQSSTPTAAAVPPRELASTAPAGDVAAKTAPGDAEKPRQASTPAALQLEDIDLAKALRELRSEAESDGLAPHPAPLLATLSKQFRDGLPTIMYLRHDYNGAGQSAVVINGETLRVGQRSRGVELVDVLPDSVILRFQGTEFRLRALNSWVNL